MPVFYCCVPGCTSSTRRQKKGDQFPELNNVYILPLPHIVHKKKQRKDWIRLVRREKSWKPNKYTRICSLHFANDCTKPTLFPYNNYKKPLLERGTNNSYMFEEDVQTKMCDDTEMEDLPLDTDTIPYVAGEVEITSATNGVGYLQRLKEFEIDSSTIPDHEYCHTERTKSLVTCDAICQTELSSTDLADMEMENRNMKAKLEDKSTLLREAFIEKVIKNDSSVRIYTGLQSVAFLVAVGIYNILISSSVNLKYWSGRDSVYDKLYQTTNRRKPGPARKLNPFEEFIMTLVRLRLGLLESVTADIFGVSSSRVSQIFITWITFMSKNLGKLIKWPTKSQVKKYMPLSFKINYPRTRAIIDCTEFYFQRPRSPSAQASTYSTYKSRNTGKCLVAISPSGTFTFISDIYGGNVSDRFITAESGVVDLVEEGDDIMADRGFTVRDLLTDKKATLNMPPFTRKCSWGKNKHLNISEIKQTRKIAKLRIHVERAIQRLKLLKLLGNTIPWTLKPVTNQMVKVAAFICNLMPVLVRN